MSAVTVSPANAVRYRGITGIDPEEAAGLRAVVRARSTRTLVGLYQAAEGGIEDDPETPWATVCETHGSVVCHAFLRDARGHLSHPEGWCEECRTVKAPTP